MKNRVEVSAFVMQQLGHSSHVGRTADGDGATTTGRAKGEKQHYGLQELRDLLDFIYGGPPDTREEEIWNYYADPRR